MTYTNYEPPKYVDDGTLPYTVSYETDANGNKVEVRRYKPGYVPPETFENNVTYSNQNNVIVNKSYSTYGETKSTTYTNYQPVITNYTTETIPE